MKKRVLFVPLFIGLIFFNSCDRVKKAFHETFSDENQRQEELSDAFNNPNSGTRNGKDEVGREKTIEDAMKELRTIINEHDNVFDKQQMEKVEEMVKKEMEKWGNMEFFLLFQPDKLDKIQEELYLFLNTDEVMLYSSPIFVDYDRVRVVAVNPKNKSEVDWYSYETKTDKWRKQEPKKLSKNDLEHMDKNIYPFSTIKLSTAHQVYTEALKRLADIEGGELPSGPTYYHNRQLWSMILRGSRADYKFEADKDGNVIKFEMN
ncbi:MAG: hypothetical protein ACOYEG_11675 [Petrimonas sp.]|jgi:hypothetical protein